MKKLFIILCIILNYGLAFSTENTNLFENISIENAIEKANHENKNVFLYFHFKECGGCIKMDKNVFINKNIQDLLKQKFVLVNVITTEKEGKEISLKYKVSSNPAYIILDIKGNLLHKFVGIYSQVDFINELNKVNTSHSSNYLNELYKTNKNDKKFLKDYIYNLEKLGELDNNYIHDYINLLNNEEFIDSINIKFIYDFMYWKYKPTFEFNSREMIYFRNNLNLFKKYHNPEQIDNRLLFISLEELDNIVNDFDSTLYFQILETTRLFNKSLYTYNDLHNICKMLLEYPNHYNIYKMKFYKLSKNFKDKREILNGYLTEIWDDAKLLNEYAWLNFTINDEELYDKEFAKEISFKVIIRSLELKKDYATLDTYASILYKYGNYIEAKEQAINAINLAKSNNLPSTETEKLLDLINIKLEN
jgi:thioredoxin-related protein